MKQNRKPTLDHDDLNALSIKGRIALQGFSVFRCSLKDCAPFSGLNRDFAMNFFSIGTVISGSVDMVLDQQNLTFKNRDLFFISPLTSLSLSAYSNDCTIEGLSFTEAFFLESSLPENITATMESFALKCDVVLTISVREKQVLARLLSKLINRIMQIDSHTYGTELLINTFTEYLIEFGAIIKKFDIAGGFNLGRKEELTLLFIRLAKANFKEQREISFYSTQLSVTAKHLSETIKKVTGKTATDFLEGLSLLEAKRLLANTQLTISAISWQLKFSNPANFSRFFVHHEDLSPREYRKLKNYDARKE